MRRLRLAGLVFGALLPGPLKRTWLRRVFGYRIASSARIGLALLDARELELGPGVEIGHFSAVLNVERFVADEKARGDRAVPATAQRSRLTASRCRPRLGN